MPSYEIMDEAKEAEQRREALLHPLKDAANRVGREVEKFAEVLDRYNPLRADNPIEKKEMAFELIEEYHAISVKTVERLRNDLRFRSGKQRKELKFGSPDAMDEDEPEDLASGSQNLNKNTTPEDLEHWKKETRTWDLLHRMATLQFSPPQPQPTNHIHRYSPEIEVWQSFLQNDPIGLERCTVLQWLKDTANETGEDIHALVQELQQNAERGDITAHGWLHTKEAIKKQKRLHAWPYILDHTSPDVQRIHLNQTKTEPLISQLDPDAPGRQDRKLEAPDEYFERSIWLGCYELLRRGKTGKEIKDWCQERQEVWRAVSMSGLPDMLMLSENGSDFKSKALWRRMCHALTKREGVETYEAAVYGILAGDYYSIEPVCKNWDDFLFMHYNAQLRSQYENYVLENFPSRVPKDALSAFEAFDAISFYGDAETVPSRTVAMVNRVRKVEPELRQPLKHIQGALIAKDFRKFILAQGRALRDNKCDDEVTSRLLKSSYKSPEKTKQSSTYVKHDDFDGLRILTHMLLAFKSFGMDMGTDEELEAIESIIVCYITLLQRSGKEEMIPIYVCQLSEDRCYATLARVLHAVGHTEERENQVKLMQELGLDVQRFIKLQLKTVLEDHPDNETGYLAEGFKILDGEPTSIEQPLNIVQPDFLDIEAETSDRKIISAFQWYGITDGMWSETFHQGVELYTRFFKLGKLAAARTLFDSMRAEDVCAVKTPSMMGWTYSLDQLANGQIRIEKGFDEMQMEEARNLGRFMAKEARVYVDLEKLIVALITLDDAAGGMMELQEAQAYVFTYPLHTIGHILTINRRGDIIASREMREAFAAHYDSIRGACEVLLDDWLPPSFVSSQPSSTSASLEKLRSTYLPPVLLAYGWFLQAAGLYISRENFLAGMDVSARIAQSSSLVKTFVETGNMKLLVEGFAGTSAALVRGVQGKNIKLSGEGKAKGWNAGLWKV